MCICDILIFTLAMATGSTLPHTTLNTDVETNETNLSVPTAIGINFTSSNQTAEISSSENVTDDDFSHLVAILHTNNFLLGAGAIVGEQWILATAFQLGAFKAAQLTVRVGSTSAVSGGQLFAVEKVFPHPMFKQFNNDVALLKTNETIVLKENAPLITLAESPPGMGEGAVLWVWGNDYTVEKNLADILPVSECRMFYPEYDLTESNICAVLDHILPFQVGLYGSPLVYNRTLVGLYMGLEAGVFKPSLCSSLPPLVKWVNAMMTNTTETQLMFPLNT